MSVQQWNTIYLSSALLRAILFNNSPRVDLLFRAPYTQSSHFRFSFPARWAQPYIYFLNSPEFSLLPWPGQGISIPKWTHPLEPCYMLDNLINAYQERLKLGLTSWHPFSPLRAGSPGAYWIGQEMCLWQIWNPGEAMFLWQLHLA